ncbi:MAG: hypothetical protein WDZ76_06090 [Pseudohongiellaceae bacterium]
MTRSFVHFMLILLLAAPLNYGALSWMAMNMPESTGQAVHIETGMTGKHHHAMTSEDALRDTGSDRHHDDMAECDEHCMNCSTHCFSSVAVASTLDDGPKAVRRLHRAIPGDILNRASLLFRPPIHA